MDFKSQFDFHGIQEYSIILVFTASCQLFRGEILFEKSLRFRNHFFQIVIYSEIGTQPTLVVVRKSS